MIHSTMSDFPLTINAILRHGRRVHGDSECVTFTGDGTRRARYCEVADNADRLAHALQRLGLRAGDPVGTFMWNNQEHLEAYFAVPCMGAVLHTVNIRLSHEQLVLVVEHARDRVVLVDDSLVPAIAPVATELTTVEAWIVVGDGDATALERTGRPVHRYHELLAAEPAGFDYPEPDEVADLDELKQFLAGHVAKWQVPERWALVDVIPKTSVGKFDKRALRTQYEKGDLSPTTA
jgi:fatty-acyl-CoA synthase